MKAHTCTHTDHIAPAGGYWGVWRTPVTLHLHTRTHTPQTSSCPLTLDDPSCAPEALSSSSPLLVFLCCCCGFLFRSWGFYCCVTAVPVYPVTACCSLCPPSSQMLLLPLFECRFASQVASYSLYCTILIHKADGQTSWSAPLWVLCVSLSWV